MSQATEPQSTSPDLTGMLRLGVRTSIAPPTQTLDVKTLAGQHILIIDDGSDLTSALIQALRGIEARPLLLQGADCTRSAPTVKGDWQQPLDIERCLERLRQVAGDIAGILFLSTDLIPFDQQWVSRAIQQLRIAIASVRGAYLTHDAPLQFVYFITRQGGRFGIDTHDRVNALAPGLEAIAHPLRLEMPKTSFRSIDLDPATLVSEQAQQVLCELAQPDQPYRTAYGWKAGVRAMLSVQQTPMPTETTPLTRQSVVVFAGGARGIGAVCAKALAAEVGCTTLFLGRTALAEEAWKLSRLSEGERKQRADQFTKDYKATHPGCPPRAPKEAWKKKLQAVEAVETVQTIQATGAKADYFAVDVRDREAVLNVFHQIKQAYGRIDVVVHVAGLGGVDTDRMLLRKDWAIIDQVLETKVIGAMHILQAAEAIGVSQFIGFGSIASRFGNTGQVDYAAANGLLTGLARAHNARGQLPIARILAWGAWDGVGMAVSGPTKDMLLAYGLTFISPEVGAACFMRELIPRVGPTTPAELYLSPSWTALTELLEQQDSLDQEEQPSPQVTQPQLLGTVVEHRPGEYLRAEHQLDPKVIPFLDHHRYDGTAWVPAVMGIEVSVEAAALLCPELIPFAVREIALKKAVRLVRDESVLLITEARYGQTVGEETQVHVTVSATFKQRTWVFAEMIVVLSANQAWMTQGLADPAPVVPLPIEQEPGEFICQTRSDLYPSDWLRFQVSGPTFQVIETLRMNCDAGRAEGTMVTNADLQACYAPITFIDGLFQAYGVLLCTILQSWAGPPLFIGEIRWAPGSSQIREVNYTIRANLSDKNYPIIQMYEPDGQCLMRMQRAEQGGTSVRELAQQARQPAPTGLGTPKMSLVKPATPYLGQVIELVPEQHLRAEQTLNPLTEVLLRDHQFAIFVVVPAVYFMEVAIEAAVSLLPQLPACELRDFQVHQMFHLLKDPQVLLTEAKVVGSQTVHVRLFSQRGTEIKLHAEGTVVLGTTQPLGTLPPVTLANAQIRTSDGLYPHRFPNGPIFQVIKTMELDQSHRSLSHLRLTDRPAEGCWLPMTFLDGAFQVDSATRSGFDAPSGLPKTVKCLRWLPRILQEERVLCVSTTQDDTPEGLGELFLVDEAYNILLQMSEITLTPVLPQVNMRSRA
jgi:NAD(P)-dependent dehydrogenase (short-subunit alcohol dehydrogenase family)